MNKTFAMLAAIAVVYVAPLANAQSVCPGLRAANGKCANLDAIEDAQNRAMIISTIRVSEIGTPIGDFGNYVRLFRYPNSPVYGLPTVTYMLNTLNKIDQPKQYNIVRTR